MIRFEIIDLFAEEQRPEIFADEFYGFEGRCWAGFVDGESGRGEC